MNRHIVTAFLISALAGPALADDIHGSFQHFDTDHSTEEAPPPAPAAPAANLSAPSTEPEMDSTLDLDHSLRLAKMYVARMFGELCANKPDDHKFSYQDRRFKCGDLVQKYCSGPDTQPFEKEVFEDNYGKPCP